MELFINNNIRLCMDVGMERFIYNNIRLCMDVGMELFITTILGHGWSFMKIHAHTLSKNGTLFNR